MDLFSVSLGLQQCLAYSHYPVNTSEGGSKGWEAGPAVVKEFGFGTGLQSVALNETPGSAACASYSACPSLLLALDLRSYFSG